MFIVRLPPLMTLDRYASMLSGARMMHARYETPILKQGRTISPDEVDDAWHWLRTPGVREKINTSYTSFRFDSDEDGALFRLKYL